ncbi:MAG: asparagine synthetase B family protein, partial [Longimicrobiaceae bacterium]
MCGLAGVLAAGGVPGEEERRRLRSALGRMCHRGPDDEGIFADGGVLLGHRRLSILDPSPAGHQPMASPDGRFVVVLNGEIYNYLELRAELAGAGFAFHTGTDTEVLLAAFARWGRGCLARLRGMFALAVWDRVERTLFLARDRVGEKPLYWWRDGARFVFASETRALLALLPARPGLRPEAVDQFLHWQYV